MQSLRVVLPCEPAGKWLKKGQWSKYASSARRHADWERDHIWLSRPQI